MMGKGFVMSIIIIIRSGLLLLPFPHGIFSMTKIFSLQKSILPSILNCITYGIVL